MNQGNEMRQEGNDPAGVSPGRGRGYRGRLRGLLAFSSVGLFGFIAGVLLTRGLMRMPANDPAAVRPTTGQAAESGQISASALIPAPSQAPQETAAPPSREAEAAMAAPAPIKTPAQSAPAAPVEALPSASDSKVLPPFDIASRTAHPPVTDRDSYVTWMLAHTGQKASFLKARWDRAQAILQRKDVSHDRVLEAFLMTPREFFCREPRRAYDDAAYPIGYGQTISGPHLVAHMTDYIDPQPEHKVLEIGTGSGYQSAFLSELCNHVFTIEIVPELAKETDAIFRRYEASYPEFRNVHRKIDDGYYGWAEYAPFDRIIVTCGIDHVPPELLKELAPEGIMVIPVGPPSGQTVLRIVKHVAADGSVTLDREDIFHGRRKQIFVPFTSGSGLHQAGG